MKNGSGQHRGKPLSNARLAMAEPEAVGGSVQRKGGAHHNADNRLSRRLRSARRLANAHPNHPVHPDVCGFPGRSPPCSGICSNPPTYGSPAHQRRNAPLDYEQTLHTATTSPHRFQGRKCGVLPAGVEVVRVFTGPIGQAFQNNERQPLAPRNSPNHPRFQPW